MKTRTGTTLRQRPAPGAARDGALRPDRTAFPVPDLEPLNPPTRILLGPGPSNVHPAVLRVMSTGLLGHLDPAFIAIMDAVKQRLKAVFQTRYEQTIPVSGTGTAGMETCLSNLIADGDPVVVCAHGYFGERMVDMAQRFGGRVTRLATPWGHPTDPDALRKIAAQARPRLIAIVHAETSTGVLQPMDEIAEIAREYDALLVLDTVTSLGGLAVEVDRWGVDACYSATQKCLGAPPGLSPITISDRAWKVIRAREKTMRAWYLDLALLEKYWSGGRDRVYHHTAPITMIYALHTALGLLLTEGLERSHARHLLNHRAMTAGLEAIGLELLVEPAYRLPVLMTPQVPAGIDDGKVRQRLLNDFDIEIGGGFGELKGKIWRIGLMGYSSNKRHVMTFLSALEAVLHAEGYPFEHGAALRAANEVYLANEP